MTGPRGDPWRWDLPTWAFVVLVVFTALAVGGYGVFGLHPAWIPDIELARRFYTVSFEYFGRAHVVVAGLAMAVALTRWTRLRWIPSAILVSLAAFIFEWLGTTYGVPFGGYRYTELLGSKLAGQVPLLIPPSWYLMALPSYLLADRLLAARPLWVRIATAVGLLVSWDLALDPAMSRLTPYWIWSEPGPYYGMPLLNLAGWAATGTVLMAVLRWTGAHAWGRAVPTTWLAAYYLAVLALPVGMLAAAGVWGAVLVTLSAVALLSVWMAPGRPLRRPAIAWTEQPS